PRKALRALLPVHAVGATTVVTAGYGPAGRGPAVPLHHASHPCRPMVRARDPRHVWVDREWASRLAPSGQTRALAQGDTPAQEGLHLEHRVGAPTGAVRLSPHRGRRGL